MYRQLIPILAPVALCALLGFGWARSKVPFDRAFVTRVVMNIGAPCLILDGIGRLQADTPAFLLTLMVAVLALAICASAGYAVLRLGGQPLRSHLPPVVFGNVGNLGLPLCLFAFGREGLGLALAFFVVGAVAQFIIGPLFQGRDPAWLTLLRTPIIYAVVAALLILSLKWSLPLWLSNSVELIGGVSIPLMLLALGHALGSFQVDRLAAATRIAVLRLGLGFAAGLALAQMLGLEGVMRGVVIIESSMPVAVFNFLLADRYDRHPADVAGAIVVSTLIAFVVLPVLLLFVLPAQVAR
jgi:malate permease and related proteins